jgi:hypothetical protein
MVEGWLGGLSRGGEEEAIFWERVEGFVGGGVEGSRGE